MREWAAIYSATLVLASWGLGDVATQCFEPNASDYAGPAAMVPNCDGSHLYVACAGDRRIAICDVNAGRIIRSISLPCPPLGLTLSRDDKRLYVTCAAASSTICVIDASTGEILHRWPAGHTTMAPVLSADEQTLYVCNRFNDEVAFISARTGQTFARVPVLREPVAAALSPDGGLLLVANHLHAGRANADVVTASVSVIDTQTREVRCHIPLANGSGLLRDIRVSPDGKFACVTHLVGRFHWIPRTVEFGWINQNAVSLIDLETLTCFSTVLLDELHEGAANPWALAWSADGQFLCVTHAGTHELSVLQFPALLQRLRALPARVDPPPGQRHVRFAHYQRPGHKRPRSREAVQNDLRFVFGIRERIKLDGHGPRALAVIGQKAYVACYFSDSLTAVELTGCAPAERLVRLSPDRELSQARFGERCFNDADLCFQRWQSCASCHDSDGRTDALNWDLLNDGTMNAKNVRSLLLAHATPPAMALRVRDNAETAVRAGLHHILFSNPSLAIPEAIDEFITSLQPLPSPWLVKGELSAAAQRGKRLFMDPKAGCATCHPAPLFTNLREYDVGTAGDYDKETDQFDNPTLIELWRTAPYLHDGSAATIRDVLTTRNPDDQHGATSHLTAGELDDLVEYLRSL